MADQRVQTIENMPRWFRGIESVAAIDTLSKRFDEPTFFSFRLSFGEKDDIYNVANDQAQYDTMPHPLFSTNTDPLTYERVNLTSMAVPGVGTVPNVQMQSITQKARYSAVDYLVNANEPTRAYMLEDFINKFNVLQSNYPYYFQEITGIGDLLKIDTTKGQRVLSDKKLTITCLEGLDLRMSYLMNLYRKIVWDDVYQRWVLPDMMRYFTLNIYLSEFRTFHAPSYTDSGAISGYSVNLAAPADKQPVYLRILDDILPTWKITCEMCEFDINDLTFTHTESMNISTPTEAGVKIGIKVGNVKEMQVYPTFWHKYLVDRKLNGLNRTKDELSTGEDNNPGSSADILAVAQNRDRSNTKNAHLLGMPYVERTNENNLNEANNAQEAVGGTFDVNFSETRPETWVGNAINFGKAYAQNFANKYINKAKITSIPGLGVSFTEVKTAIQSKNIVAALGMIRKGVNDVVQSYGNAPSSRLDGQVQTDNIMKEFLTTLTKSEATDDDTRLLAGAAGIALSDNGVWQQIKDYSLATNLIGPGETNTLKSLEGTDQYQQLVEQQALLGASRLSGGALPRVDPNAASGAIGSQIIDLGAASERLTGNVSADDIERGASSERLGATTEGDALNRIKASDRLGYTTQGTRLPNGKASERLSTQTENAQLPGAIPSSQLDDAQMQSLETGAPSSKLSSRAEGTIEQPKPNVKTKTIDISKVIEYDPTSILYGKIQGEQLKQPKPSKATNSKLEQ